MSTCEYFRVEKLNLPAIVKEIGRGKNAAGDLPREHAQTLFSAILAGEVPDLELGAILIALRVKGESLDELAGFMAACEASYPHLQCSAVPVVIPSYNGARVLPNLVPLLALLLAREGIPMLIHGVTRDPGRVTTHEVLTALGIAPAESREEAASQLELKRIAFLPIDVLAPAVARVLTLRGRLGVRNSTHTLVKMLQPFAGQALRIVSVTHPEYLVRMREYFTRYASSTLLLRGAEGEAVAHPRREPSIDWVHGGTVNTWTQGGRSTIGSGRMELELPYKDAESTARWTEAALDGKAMVPAPIMHQVECCKRALAALG